MDGGKKAGGSRDKEGGTSHTQEVKDTEKRAADGDDSPPETEMGKTTVVDENEATTERINGEPSGRSPETSTAAEGICPATSGFKNAEDGDDSPPETEPSNGGPLENPRKRDGKKRKKQESSPEAGSQEFHGGDTDDSDGRDGLLVREMAIMKSMLHHRSQSGKFPSLDSKEFREFVSKLLREDFTWQQLGDDIQQLKNRYEKVVEEMGGHPQFKTGSQTEAFKLSGRIWDGGAGSDSDADAGGGYGSQSSHAIALLPVLRRRRPTKEEEPARPEEEQPVKPEEKAEWPEEEAARQEEEEVRLRIEIRERIMEMREIEMRQLELRRSKLEWDLQDLLARYQQELRRRDP